MHRAPHGKFVRKHAPLAAAFQQVEHRTKDLLKIHCAQLGALAHALQQRPNLFELLTTEVTRILLLAHASTIVDSQDCEQALRRTPR